MLLGERFDQLEEGLSLRAPVDWTSVTAALLREIADSVNAVGGDTRLMPDMVALFRHPAHGAHLAVAKYPVEFLPADRDSVIQRQSRGLRQRYGKNSVLATRFSHNGCEFDQLLVTGGEHVVIKLFVHRRGVPMYHLDYVVAAPRYREHARAIESSIGSLSFNP